MTDKVPAILASPLYVPEREFVPGSSTDYSCKVCTRRLVVSPSSIRHMARTREQYEFMHLCPWCADQIAELWKAQGSHDIQVAMAPGADAEMRAAGLDADADETASEAARLRSLFRRDT